MTVRSIPSLLFILTTAALLPAQVPADYETKREAWEARRRQMQESRKKPPLSLGKSEADGRVAVIVMLDGAPAATFFREQQPALLQSARRLDLQAADVELHRAALRDRRALTRRRLEDLGFEHRGEADVVVHAMFGSLPAEGFDEAAVQPGVLGVFPVRWFQAHLDGAIPLLNVISGWQLLGGESQAGRGVRIGIIDTGIDINHPMLQDPSLTAPPGFPKGETALTNSKVIVARNYLNLLGDPRDTSGAMDRIGHGTFVAATAAGRRALAPLAEVAGVAPAAFLGNYRVFGSPLLTAGTNDAAIIAALNDAVADGMNVVNISIGSFPVDLPSVLPLGQAVTNTARAGVLVVAAAGNDGPLLGTVSEPSNSPEALAVGATRNQRVYGNPVRVTGPGEVPPELARLVSVGGDGPAPAGDLNLPLWAVAGSTCSPLAGQDAEQVRDAIALYEDSFCADSTIIGFAANAGAKAVIIYRTDDGDPFPPAGASQTTIPSFAMARLDGAAIARFARSSTTGRAGVVIEKTVSAIPVEADRIAPFSSAGPDSMTLELKPDLTATGTSILSATELNDVFGALYHPSQFLIADGTSFSSGLVSGAAALVKQRRPAWTPAQIKSALVHSTANVVKEGAQQARLVVSGSGRMDVGAALRAAAAFEPAGLSFGQRVLNAALNVQRSFTITHLGDTPESYTLEVRPRGEVTGATVAVSPATVGPLGPRESATVQVTLTANPPVTSRNTLDGRIRVTGSSGAVYNVAYWGDLLDSTIASRLFRIRGNGQTELVSTALPVAIVSQVTDFDLVGVAGVPVTFAVTRGGGSLSAPSTTTDFSGLASVTWTLGETPGIQQMTASGVNRTVTFTATARANPQFSAAGVVNAASFTGNLAAGGMVSLFGTGLASKIEAAASLPLPGKLGDAQVTVNGVPAPLYFASPRQINFQMPFETPGNAAMRVSVLGTTTAAVTLNVAQAAPGLFTTAQTGQGTVVALHGTDNAPVTSSNPARAGETVVLYGAGLGPVEPAVASGAPAPSDPPARTRTAVNVRVGTQQARVVFSGLAPGFVGLYQVNFEVPAGAGTGDLPLALSVGSANSNQVTLPVQ